MAEKKVEILMIVHNRPGYTRRSLPTLLESCGSGAGVWIWQNGQDPGTTEIVESYREHPSVVMVHKSAENVGIRHPTNWFWENSTARLVGKVDDDCLVPPGWIESISEAHAENPEFGSVACWHFREEDFDPGLSAPKIRSFNGDKELLVNFWTPGSGYLLKRDCIEQLGPIGPNQTFTGYCIKLALGGWVNGWHFPLILQDHMDDPRSPFTELRSDGDLRASSPLSAQANRATSLEEWDAQHRRSARLVQAASIDPRDYRGARLALRKLRRKGRKLITGHYW